MSRVPICDVPRALRAAGSIGMWPRKSALFHDLDALRSRVEQLHDAFPVGTLHAVAIKANPVIRLLEHLVSWGVGLEAASWEEVECALAAGCAADRIVFDSPAKTMDELEASLKLGLFINVDSETELKRIQVLLGGSASNSNIGIRVNPMLGEGSIAFTSTVGKSSQFGVPIARIPTLLHDYPFVNGLHVHTGSQGVGLDLIRSAVQCTAEIATKQGLQWLDIGGGIPVQYRDDDATPPTFAAWASCLEHVPDTLQILTEPGRSIHAGSGFAISRIESVKQVDGESTLIVHLGADLLLRRVYRANEWDHEFVVLHPDGQTKAGPFQPTRIAGPLCFSGDMLAHSRALATAKPGDLLLIRDTGAYTLSMWSRHCSRALPPTIGYAKDQAEVLHRGETPQDVVAFWR